MLMRSKHHCRCCAREYCDAHSQKRADVPSLKVSQGRVCDYCYAHLTRGDEQCVARLVPYLSEDDLTRREQALGELATLLLPWKDAEHLPATRVHIALLNTLTDARTSGAPSALSKALAALAVLAAKGAPQLVPLLQGNPGVLARWVAACSSAGPARAEALKGVAFLAMQATMKHALQSADVLGAACGVLGASAGGRDDAELQWAAMIVYYYTVSCAPPLVRARGRAHRCRRDG